MELLAPVGSKESFITAIRGGANAVYMGVPDFNARVSASNITLFDLKVLIDYAHQQNVKVHLALNTLIKHEEINDAVKNVAYVAKLKPDAVIVQDLGIAGIIKEYYPDLTLHASTQMAVHNRMGVDFLARQGFKRVIMARELSFSELKSIVKGAPAEIEIFCHGALCFSLSGMCLFSSYIGGMSGNRGRCTQPCRRLWEQGNNRGYMFSPKDMELAEHVNKLKKLGIASLKIEGRMRSSEYVYRVVKAYRMLIDAPDADFDRALKEAKEILSNDAAREKTTCLFSGRDDTIFQPHKAQCLGNNIGTIDSIAGGSISISVPDESINIIEGDRLRLSNPAKDITIAFKVKETPVKEGRKYIIPFSKAGDFAVGNPVFKTVDVSMDQKNIEHDIDSIYQNFNKNKPHEKYEEKNFSQKYTALISNQWKEFKNKPLGEVEDSLYIRFDDIEWLEILPKSANNTTFVFYLTKENLHQGDKLPDGADEVQFLAGELPPFIGQRDVPLFKQCIDKMILAGVKKWVVNNISQLEYFKDTDCELTAGQFMYTWNAYTAAFLSKFGVKYFVTSWEDEFLNIRKLCGPGLAGSLIVYLYGFVPVVRSRMITGEMLSEEIVKSTKPVSSTPIVLSAEADKTRHGDNYAFNSNAQQAGQYSDVGNRHKTTQTVSFKPVFESELALLLPEKPLSIFTGRRKLKECGISRFGIDLNFIQPDRKFWNAVINGYKEQENIVESIKFNFKQGVK